MSTNSTRFRRLWIVVRLLSSISLSLASLFRFSPVLSFLSHFFEFEAVLQHMRASKATEGAMERSRARA